MATTRSVLPHFGEKKASTAAFVGSISGWAGDPGAGPYCGLVECLQQETAQFGIQSVIFEPGYYQTEIMSPSNVKSTPSCILDHEEMEKSIVGFVAALHGDQPGDPRKLVKRIIDVVKSEGMAAGKPMPQRPPIGRDAMAAIVKKGEATLQFFKEWESLITSTNIESSESA